MPKGRITIRVPDSLENKLRGQARLKGRSESQLVREALETYLGQEAPARSAYELAEEAGLIGCVRRAPKDLSTHRKHFEGFGKSR
jgi:predicted DNA-binding protein